MWTRFMDAYSGGGQKEPWPQIWIEAPEKEAKLIFYNRFGHNPDRVTCTCCGADYSIHEHETLEEATAYERGLRYAEAPRLPNGKYDNANSKYLEPNEDVPDGFTISRLSLLRSRNPPLGKTLEEFLSTPFQDILVSKETTKTPLVIYATDIKQKEREGSLPIQGYVWVD